MRLRRPTAFALLLAIFGVAAFVSLGMWQLDRARQKETLLERFANAAHAPAQPFGAVEHGISADAYPRVQVQGSFDPQRVYLLDNRMQGDQLGVDVFAAFTPRDRDRVLLVDLGFLPRQGPRATLPLVPSLTPKRIALRGLYAPAPAPGLKLGGDALPRQPHWPKLVTYIDLDDIAADLHRQVYPRVLLPDADPASGYVRQWTPDTFPPARHRAYAFQWFTFALAAIVIFFVMHRKKRET